MKKVLALLILLIPLSCFSASDGYKRNHLLDVTNYSFTISISDTANTIFGRASVTMLFKDDSDSLMFDLKNLRTDGKGMIVDSVIFSESGKKWRHLNDRITVVPEKPVKKGTKAVLRVIYHGIPADGLIISNNKFGDRTFFSDNWPDRASNYLPCIDHPYDKATVDFFIIAPLHYDVVASGFLVEESRLSAGRKMTHWKEEVPIATKVMAFGAADFDFQLAGTPDKIPVWTYVFRENRDEGFYDYSVAVKPLAFYSQLIGPYPYEKLANVQSKTIFGGLENAGCIFYAENSITGSGKAESLMAHEIAHQWFGNSVTENDWDHIWLSEGFATYLTSVYIEKNYGEEMFSENMKKDRERVINYSETSARPVVDTTVTDLMGLLNINSYQKGAWVLHMLRHEVGDEIFWKGIRLYYERFRNRNALTEDFKKVMEEISGKDLSSFFRQWLYTAGQPELEIISDPSGIKGQYDIFIEQKQSSLFSFPIELLVRCREGNKKLNAWITERETKLIIKTDGIDEIIPDPDVNLLFRLINN